MSNSILFDIPLLLLYSRNIWIHNFSSFFLIDSWSIITCILTFFVFIYLISKFMSLLWVKKNIPTMMLDFALLMSWVILWKLSFSNDSDLKNQCESGHMSKLKEGSSISLLSSTWTRGKSFSANASKISHFISEFPLRNGLLKWLMIIY